MTSSDPTDAARNDPSRNIDDYGGWSGLISELTDGKDLSRAAATAAMTDVLSGNASQIQIAAFLVGVKAKGETVDELTGFAEAMRGAADSLSLDPSAIDIVGTGGSDHRRRHALNVSTMASIVAASAGAIVCKHGNRKASSTSGSFDFLEALGVSIDLGPRQVEECVAEIGLGFAFSRNFHPAMRFAGPVRVELGVPTVFNVLGPLAHPGRIRRQVVGVSSPKRAEVMAEVLHALGVDLAWVVSGYDGLDELSTTGGAVVFSVDRNGVRNADVRIDDLGIPRASLDQLIGGSPQDNTDSFQRILAGRSGPHRDIVQLNAAAGLVVSGAASDLAQGLELAGAAIDDGRAGAKLQDLRRVTKRLALPDQPDGQ